MRVILGFCLAVAPIALVHAQLEVIGDTPPPADQAALQAQGAKLQTDFNAAQAKAARKGDDKMTCDQIHAELVTTLQSPGFQQFVVQQQAALSTLASSTGLTSFGVLAGMQSLLAQGALSSGSAPAAQPAGGDAGAKKVSLFKKLSSFGQVAGAAASGLGGVGHGVGSAAGTVETVAGAAQVAGAAGASGNTTGEVAAAANAANVVGGGGNAGVAAAAGVANSAAAVSNVHAAQSAGAPHAAAATPNVSAAAYQGLSANGAQAALQVGQAAVNSPDVMRAAHLGQLADSKGCKFQIDNSLTPH
jgi:hypothetical protein